MATIAETLSQRIQATVDQRFNWNYWLLDNLTGSKLLTVWVSVLALATVGLTIRQLIQFPAATTLTLVLWLVGITLAASEGLHLRYTRVGRWLKTNLLSSISNALLTLFLLLALFALVHSIWLWAAPEALGGNATFAPELAAPEFQSPDGASWGVIWGARALLLVGQFPRDQLGRVWVALFYFVVLGLISYVLNKIGIWGSVKPIRRFLTALWLISPMVVYVLLAGVPPPADGSQFNLLALIIGEIVILVVYGLLWWQRVIRFSALSLAGWAVAWPLAVLVWRLLGQSELLPPINPTNWGGLLLTLIIAASVILLSFPIGMALALGRRSQVRGIPWWLIWPVAIGAAIWGLTNSTPTILDQAEGTIQRLLAFWPLLLLIIAYILQRMFWGNVISAASTTFIEVVRGVPLITLLFMAIIMAPFFLPEGAKVERVVSVIVGYTLFSAAYMAELIRGGLQAIPRGQYDAADAIGLNSLQKMRFIILPQAITIVIPGIVGQFIGSFKSSSLVAIVGLFELLGVTKNIIANEQWLGLRQELYVFVAIVYFTGSSIMSWYSRRLERRLRVGQN
jgi:His/Glu/Gln/Arg/opine family amino acid ABC transporter permease subunit